MGSSSESQNVGGGFGAPNRTGIPGPDTDGEERMWKRK